MSSSYEAWGWQGSVTVFWATTDSQLQTGERLSSASRHLLCFQSSLQLVQWPGTPRSPSWRPEGQERVEMGKWNLPGWPSTTLKLKKPHNSFKNISKMSFHKLTIWTFFQSGFGETVLTLNTQIHTLKAVFWRKSSLIKSYDIHQNEHSPLFSSDVLSSAHFYQQVLLFYLL